MSPPSFGRLVLTACTLLATPGLAQPADPFAPTPDPFAPAAPPAPGQPDPAQPQPFELDQIVPHLRVGYRAEALRQKQTVIPVVVIVPDTGSYVRALAAWEPLRRFPVLIDDGTPGARDDIARFVRGFAPEHVVRWSAPVLPPVDTPAQVRAIAEDTLRDVWNYGTESTPLLHDAVRGFAQVEAPGVVIANPTDPAWTAALALGVGRGQPILWIEARQGVDDALTKEEGDALALSIEQSLDATGLSWNALGDMIDTLALCLNTPARTAAATPGDWVATTDRLGRTPTSPTDNSRWAWASQVHGTSSQAAYRAMSALFLPMPAAWLFDSYPGGQPWASYSLQFAAQTFSEQGGLAVVLATLPNNGVGAWRGSAADSLDAPLVMVNTKGMRDYFELIDGTNWCGDIPFLNQPSAVYFIHSWSAFQPADRNTLAGRWFERGAYAYCGSVQEPYLSAFVRPGDAAIRLLALAPWSVACRMDGTPPWRLAIFGDPLLTVCKAQGRVADALPLAGAQDVADLMRAALREGDLATTIHLLALLGRDADAARLVATLRIEAPDRLTPAVAVAALGPLFRARRHADFQAIYPRLDELQAADPVNVDMLWLSCRASLPANATAMALLRTRIRPEQQTPDTIELAVMATVSGQRERALSMLTEWRRTRTEASEQRLIDQAVAFIRGL